MSEDFWGLCVLLAFGAFCIGRLTAYNIAKLDAGRCECDDDDDEEEEER